MISLHRNTKRGSGVVLQGKSASNSNSGSQAEFNYCRTDRSNEAPDVSMTQGQNHPCSTLTQKPGGETASTTSYHRQRPGSRMRTKSSRLSLVYKLNHSMQI